MASQPEPLWYSGDGVHPNANGAAFIGEHYANYIAPIIEELDKEQNGLCVCKVNVDNETPLAIAFKVQYIPTLVYIKNGEIVDTITGLNTKEEILALINK